jgi:hypothetical protein
MATFTITTAQNIDELTSKAGGDTYNINGGYLTVDQDTRVGLNQNTSASLGTVTLSATLGGTVEVNSTLVRLIPYNSGTGNVPAWNTSITQGSASGKLIGVYSALNVASTATGAAMPASGYIKIKQWNSVAYTSGALTNIGASATGADVAGWLEIVGDEAGTCTVNRLNLFKVRGGYYQIGTTDGTRATTYQIPSSGTLQYHAGVEVETATSSGVYEFYPCAGSLTALAANIATDAVRGKVCWISSAGLLRFGHDGTNSTGGYIVPSGRKIRIPNIFFANCTTAARTANVLPNATLATRFEFATTGGGAIDMDKASIGWYMNINQPYSLALTNVGILTALVATEIASPIAWSNVNVGQEAANTQIALTMNLCFAGGTMSDCKWFRAAQAASGAYVVSMTDVSGLTITNDFSMSLVKAANATTGSYTLTRVLNTTFTSPILGGGRALMVGCDTVIFTNTTYFDNPATTTGTAIPMYVWDLGTAASYSLKFDGLSFGGLTLCQPYSGVLNIGIAGCNGITLRNLGTASSPLDMGGAYVDATWTRSTTTTTVTKTAHGLKTGDIIAVNVCSDVAPKAVTTTTATLWTVASAPSADTFTVTVTNSGQTSGQNLSYYPCMSSVLVNFLAGGAANTVKIQRCYTPHLRTGVMTTGDNSAKNILVEDVWGTEWGVQLVPMLNCEIKGLQSTPALTAQTSCYGTNFLDTYTTAQPANISSVSWSRSTTVATITSTAHGLRVGDTILVTTTSDASAIILGTKTLTQITAVASPVNTANTFQFTCLNAGSASGTLTFTPINGRVAIQMNETTSDTSSQVALTGGAAFTSAGGLYMPTINQTATFTYPYNLKGHGSFIIAEAVMAGGTLTNYDVTYSLDNGSTYKNLSYPRTGAGGSNGSTNVTMTSTTGVAVNDYIFGTNIAPLAKVQSITDGTTIVSTIANTGAVSGTLRFNHLPYETISASNGTPLIIKMKTTTANATAITSLYMLTNATSTHRAATYPLDTVNITVTAKNANTLVAIEGARVLMEADTGGALPAGASVTITRSGSTASVSHSSHGMSEGQTIIIRGANQDEYNGTYTISNVTTNAYDYTVSGTPDTPATGTITSTAVILSGVTGSNGQVTGTFEYSASQPVTGKIRKGSDATFYKTSTIVGTITSTGLDTTVLLISDE